MKNEKTAYKPYRIIDGYHMKKQLHRGFKILEYYHYSNEQSYRRRTLYKNLTLTDAEDKLYRLESKIK